MDGIEPMFHTFSVSGASVDPGLSEPRQRLPTDNGFYTTRTRQWKEKLINLGRLVTTVQSVLQHMESLEIDLPILLWAVSWNNTELTEDDKVQHARTTLMVSEDLSNILRAWYRPPRTHGRGVQTKGAHDVIANLAMDIVSEEIDSDMKRITKIFKSPQDDISEESLLAIRWEPCISEAKSSAPTLWQLLRHASYTSVQEQRNIYKNPDPSILTMIAMSSYSRTHHSCKLQKLLSIYFKASGLAAKGFDTLNALGVTMSQKWTYRGIEQLSETAKATLLEYVEKYPFLASHDNVNQRSVKYEQRLSNQTHFDSGTAGTIYIVKDPEAVSPKNADVQEQRALGSQNPIQPRDVLKLEIAAAPAIYKRAVFRVLQFLMECPEFSISTYEHRDHHVFTPPPPVRCLDIKLSELIEHFMLDTLPIDEASIEGNLSVMEAFLKQLRMNITPEDMKRTGTDRTIVWIGDQLTVSRTRSIEKARSQDENSYERLGFVTKQFGFLHAQFAQEHSIHSQYYGTRNSMGLSHAFDLLKRKGLASPNVKGTFHYDIQEALYHITEARILNLWCQVGKVDRLEDLCHQSPSNLLELATKIVRHYASTQAMQDMDGQPAQNRDDLLYQALQFNRDMLDYIDLNEAMSCGDVGRMEQQLPRLLFRYIGGRNSNYTVEILELLQLLHREGTPELKEFIKKYGWLTNTSGDPNLWFPIDQLQEHHVRDIKVIFAVLGPFATWEYIRKISASIPCQRKVKDHVEAEINHYRRGKSHTSPDKHEDISRLQRSYQASKLHEFTSGRSLEERDKVKDYIARGSGVEKLSKVMGKWANNRLTERSTGENYSSEDSTSDSM